MRRHRHPCHCHYIAARYLEYLSACTTTKRTIIARCVLSLRPPRLACAAIDTSPAERTMLSFLFPSRYRSHARARPYYAQNAHPLRTRSALSRKGKVQSGRDCLESGVSRVWRSSFKSTRSIRAIIPFVILASRLESRVIRFDIPFAYQ